jgi:hypothetical protein
VCRSGAGCVAVAVAGRWLVGGFLGLASSDDFVDFILGDVCSAVVCPVVGGDAGFGDF